MYGPNYSGFAFHPKTVRMVGPVHLADFFSRSAELCRLASLGGAGTTSTHIVKLCKTGDQAAAREPTSPWDHRISGQSPDTYPLCRPPLWRPPPVAHTTLTPCATRRDEPRSRHRASAGCPGTYPHTRFSVTSPSSENKNGVFHVKHAARFPPTASTIKPFSSPAPGTFRLPADSVPVRRPALPAQTRRSPARNRSPRSVARPARSARSAASRRPSHATR